MRYFVLLLLMMALKLLCFFVLLLMTAPMELAEVDAAAAFVAVTGSRARSSASSSPNKVRRRRHHHRSPNLTALGVGEKTAAAAKNENSNSKSKRARTSPAAPRRRKKTTLADLRQEILENPAQYQPTTTTNKTKKKSSRRTRRRVESPQQKYLYAAHRQNQQKQLPEDDTMDNNNHQQQTDSDSASVSSTDNDDTSVTAATTTTTSKKNTLCRQTAQDLGMILATQHCDPDGLDEQPAILGRIGVVASDNDDDSTATASSYAYILDKPAGFSILGSSGGARRRHRHRNKDPASQSSSYRNGIQGKEKKRRNQQRTRLRIKDDVDGSVDVLEYNELDILKWLTPEELEEYEKEELLLLDENSSLENPKQQVTTTVEVSLAADDDDDEEEQEEAEEARLLVDEQRSNVAADAANRGGDDADDTSVASEKNVVTENAENSSKEPDPQKAANLRKIAARMAESSSSSTSTSATFAENSTRPSLVSWLKQEMQKAGTPIRGGKFWTAVAGATQVDDSGLVLLCPKRLTNNVFVNVAEYVAVVGNGGYLAPPSSAKQQHPKVDDSSIKLDLTAKVRKGRGDDTVFTVRALVPEQASACANIIPACQKQYQDGIRGDAEANPMERRSARRLIHCRSLSVSSLVCEDDVRVETAQSFPDDIAILADRRNHLEYMNGSFLGRSKLRDCATTTAYREINGAADGFPGWTVDRYDKWLSVYHDPKHPRGPLPSIHDGNTYGVYYLESNADRSSMGTGSGLRPRLMEGQPAPDLFPVLENGVVYQVSLSQDLSTGIFLDQRPQRLWLTRNCCTETRVLNCFAHTGAFSVAAASAGASTVSLDLSRKWLDRLPGQLDANGIEFDERQDCIYGDCFDWLTRLAKRKEKYDIVILDPPSSSVGSKKKRWSIKNDMDELVTLAAGLVKPGGLLWTTTNSASISASKFARLCHKGLEDAGVENARLERIQPMPVDFPCIGPQTVKNLVWRFP